MRKEILAGISTFFTISYLILLYPKILSEGGIDFGSALTATILTITASTLFLALYSNFPVLLAPGLSVGPFLVYSLILKQKAPWETVFGLVFWAGFVLFLLTIFRIRQKILQYLPLPVKISAIAGIGLYLICVGLKDLGFPENPLFTIQNGVVLFGLSLFFTLYYLQIGGAFIISILSCWLLGNLFGFSEFDGLFALPHLPKETFFHLDFLTPLHFEWLGALLTIVLICLFDTSASLSVLAKLSGNLDKQGNIKNVNRIMLPDGLGAMFGALLGTGSLAYTVESSAGIKAGGRGKITAITAALCCLVCLFFLPLFKSIPLFATTPVIFAIGIFMTFEIKQIQWENYTESIPSLITLFTIPIAFSIYLGFALGFVSYVILKGLKGEYKEVHPVCWALAIIFAMHLSWSLGTAQQ